MKKVCSLFFSLLLIFSCALAVSAAGLAITKQPVDYHGQIGGVATFSVTAVGDGLTYKWQYNNGTGWSSWSGTGSSLNVNIKEQNLAYKFRVVVSDSSGNSVTSNAVGIYLASGSSASHVTNALNYVISWFGEVISALVDGAFSGLLPIVAVAIAISGFMFGLKVIRGSTWGV